MAPVPATVDFCPLADEDTEASLEVARRQCLALLSKVENSRDALHRFEQCRCGGSEEPEAAQVNSLLSKNLSASQIKPDSETSESVLVPGSAKRQLEPPAQENSSTLQQKVCPRAVAAVPLPGSVVTAEEDDRFKTELLGQLQSLDRSSQKPNLSPRVGLPQRHSEPRLQTSGVNLKLGQTTRMQILKEAALEQAGLEQFRRHSAPASPVEAWSGAEIACPDDTVMTKAWSFLTLSWMKDDYVQRNASAGRRRSQVVKAKHRQEKAQLFHASSGHLTRNCRR